MDSLFVMYLKKKKYTWSVTIQKNIFYLCFYIKDKTVTSSAPPRPPPSCSWRSYRVFIIKNVSVLMSSCKNWHFSRRLQVMIQCSNLNFENTNTCVFYSCYIHNFFQNKVEIMVLEKCKAMQDDLKSKSSC